jgi:hypothetical protein
MTDCIPGIGKARFSSLVDDENGQVEGADDGGDVEGLSFLPEGLCNQPAHILEHIAILETLEDLDYRDRGKWDQNSI